MAILRSTAHAFTLCLITVGLWSCDTETPSSSTEPHPNPDENVEAFFSLSGATFPDSSYGVVTLTRSRWTSSNEWRDYDSLLDDILPDSLIDRLNETTFDSDWYSHAWAQFGSGDQASGFRINGQVIPEIDGPNSAYFYSSDQSSEPSFHTDGSGNVFETVIGGKTYRDTLAGNIGEISFSPGLMDTVDLDGFSVSWSSSNYSSDYVQITISEMGSSAGGTTTGSRETLTVFSYDDGTESISAVDLSDFSEGPARIVVRRGFVSTVLHGGTALSYILSTSMSTDIVLEK